MENQSYSPNSTNSPTLDQCNSPDGNLIFRVGLVVLYSLLFFASLVGNSLIVATVWRNDQMRSAANLFIANMAVSDMIQTIFGIPRVLTEVMFVRERWLLGGVLGNFTCKLAYFIQDTSLSVSMISLICITIERFYAVVLPFKYSYISRHTKPAIVGTWFTGALLHSVYWKIFTLDERSKKCIQDLSFRVALTYFFVVFVGLFFVALTTTIVLYTIIIIKIKRKQVSDEHLRRNKEAQEHKLLRVAIAISVVFFACFFPQAVLIVVAPLYAIPKCHSEALRIITKVMEQTYSAVNPILCMAFSANYRSGFKSALLELASYVMSPCKRAFADLEGQRQRDSDL